MCTEAMYTVVMQTVVCTCKYEQLQQSYHKPKAFRFMVGIGHRITKFPHLHVKMVDPATVIYSPSITFLVPSMLTASISSVLSYKEQKRGIAISQHFNFTNILLLWKHPFSLHSKFPTSHNSLAQAQLEMSQQWSLSPLSSCRTYQIR